MNKDATCIDFGTKLTQRRSRPVRYRLFGITGICAGIFPTVQAAADKARQLWPGMRQADEEGPGWDIEAVVGPC